MKIAMSLDRDGLDENRARGHRFVFFEVDPRGGQIVGTTYLTSPPQQPGGIPCWLEEHDADLVIARSIGHPMQAVLQGLGMQVATVIWEARPEDVVGGSLEDALGSGDLGHDHPPTEPIRRSTNIPYTAEVHLGSTLK
jgi:predicted Fe-Mo cluster-binding NifX family protein